MKLAGYQARLAAHQERMARLEASGELQEMYHYRKCKWARLHQRLGYLKQKVESLQEKENGR